MNILSPSFFDLAQSLHMTDQDMQTALSLHFLGFCGGALLYGPLSEQWGRTSVLLGGYGLMVVGAWGCAVSWNKYVLMIFRFLQGNGTSAPMVLVFTLVSELFSEKKATKIIGHFHAYLAIALCLAPIGGELLQAWGGWRINHGAFALGATLIYGGQWYKIPYFLPSRSSMTLRHAFFSYGTVLRHKDFMVCSMILSLFSTIFMIYLATSVLCYNGHFGLHGTAFLYHYCTVLGVFSGVSLMMGFIVQYVPSTYAIRGAFWCCVLSIVMGGIHTFFSLSGTAFTLYFCVFGGGYAVLYPLILSRALALCSGHKGVASSCLMALRAFVMTAGLGSVRFMPLGVSPVSQFFCPLLGCILLALGIYGYFGLGGRPKNPL